MSITYRLRRHASTLCKALVIGIGLAAVNNEIAQAQTQSVQTQTIALDSEVINPAKLKETPLELAQRRGRRSSDGTTSDFIGLGLSLGTGDGDGALEELGLAAISKLSFAPQLSVRPAVVVNDSAAVIAPVTYNFQSPATLFNASIFPYVGGGIAINATEDDVAPLVSAGVDVPFSERMTLNGQSNITLADDITVHFMFGLGYNIDGLF
ncbi:hypothetical protein [Leptothoe kymatousa]|uniref:Outer membrane protein beta-barrel domain-containing protein n=1 Tax=Leptothoe kymatousa TAU-MAC 1615 TaxID=2364775 RepID=A0ABS5Y448_9CYAN|nr:hypothetical protein [Leptothoe kymatousa]MBT9312134.1 hypothetical protein [Leptothoe kymatousa TAU-MAC 1615]